MGLEKSNQVKTTFVTLLAKTGDGDDTPYFSALGKDRDEWVEVGEKMDRISGRLVDIEHQTYPYQNDVKHKVVFKFVDASGQMKMQANFNNLTYSILNSLLSCHPDEIAIEVWLGKEKMIGGKPKRFPSAKVINNGDKLDWAIEAMGMPKAEKVKVRNMTVTDNTLVYEFWIDVINQIRGKMGLSKVREVTVSDEEYNRQFPKQVAPSRIPPNTRTEEPDYTEGRAGSNNLGAEEMNDLPF